MNHLTVETEFDCSPSCHNSFLHPWSFPEGIPHLESVQSQLRLLDNQPKSSRWEKLLGRRWQICSFSETKNKASKFENNEIRKSRAVPSCSESFYTGLHAINQFRSDTHIPPSRIQFRLSSNYQNFYRQCVYSWLLFPPISYEIEVREISTLRR